MCKADCTGLAMRIVTRGAESIEPPVDQSGRNLASAIKRKHSLGVIPAEAGIARHSRNDLHSRHVGFGSQTESDASFHWHDENLMRQVQMPSAT